MLRELLSRVQSDTIQPEEDPNSIGNLALEKGYINESDLREAVEVQKERLQLGQILLEMGKLTEEQLECLLMEQRIRRGEKVSADELRRHERKKVHRRLKGMAEGFQAAGNEARSMAKTVTAHLNGHATVEKIG